MNRAVPFIASDHLSQLNQWHSIRGLSPVNRGDLPSTGFIVLGIAAGFLYLTDSNLAFLDGYIANPETTSLERKPALDLITDCLMDAAQKAGVKRLVSLSANPSIQARSLSSGFTSHGTFQLFCKEY